MKTFFSIRKFLSLIIILLWGFSAGMVYGQECPVVVLAQDLDSEVGEELIEFIEGKAVGEGVKVWRRMINAPKPVRQNSDVLTQSDELIAQGFTSFDIDLAVTVINKVQLHFQSISNSDLIKFSKFLLESKQHSVDFDQFNIITDVFGQMDIALSSNMFYFPDAEKTAQYIKEMAIKMRPNNNPPNPGFLEQLNEAIYLLDEGGEIVFENGTINGVQYSVDIIDKTNFNAIHFKAPVGTSSSTFTDNLKSAAKQFRGELEPAPQGYKAIIKVKLLNPLQPDFTKTAVELKSRIQTYININGNVNELIDDFHRLSEIQVVNQFGLSRFKVENTVVSIIQ